MIILGIESSCDETGVAVNKGGTGFLVRGLGGFTFCPLQRVAPAERARCALADGRIRRAPRAQAA